MDDKTKDGIRRGVAQWGDTAADRDIMPVLMIGISEEHQKRECAYVWGTANFPDQQSLLIFLETVLRHFKAME